MVTIRKFDNQDIDYILSNWANTFRLSGYWKTATKEKLTESFKSWENEKDDQGRPRVKYCIEAEIENKKIPVGVIFYSYTIDGKLTFNIYIDERYRKNGIAVSATKLAEEKLKEKGITKVYSSSYYKNTPSVELHKKLGFKFIKEEYSPNGNLMFRWEKEL